MYIRYLYPIFSYIHIKLTIISTLIQNVLYLPCHDPKIRTQRSRSITPVAQVLEFYETLAVVNSRRACSNLVNEVSTDRRGRVCIHLILSRCLLHSSPRYRRIARKSSVLVEASFRLFASGESISFSRVCGMARLDLTNRPPLLFHFSSLLLYPFLCLSLSVFLSLYPASIGSHQGMKADRIDLDRSI